MSSSIKNEICSMCGDSLMGGSEIKEKMEGNNDEV